MNKYEQPKVEVLSLCLDESIMDEQGITGSSGPGTNQGGGMSPFALRDSHDNR